MCQKSKGKGRGWKFSPVRRVVWTVGVVGEEGGATVFGMRRAGEELFDYVMGRRGEGL